MRRQKTSLEKRKKPWDWNHGLRCGEKERFKGKLFWKREKCMENRDLHSLTILFLSLHARKIFLCVRAAALHAWLRACVSVRETLWCCCCRCRSPGFSLFIYFRFSFNRLRFLSLKVGRERKKKNYGLPHAAALQSFFSSLNANFCVACVATLYGAFRPPCQMIRTAWFALG